MIYMFCGSSSTRQFSGDFPGKFIVNYYSGATIKGLSNEKSKENHANIISHLIESPESKRVFLMLGNADYDFSYYRYIYDKKPISDERFMSDRIDAYNYFLKKIITKNESHGTLKSIHVLAPQLSPVLDKHFIRTVALNAKMDVGRFEKCMKDVDYRHASRLSRCMRFNDLLEDGVIKHNLVKSHRIDTKMIDAGGNLCKEFFPPDRDHHAEKGATFRLWRNELREFVAAYDRAANREFGKLSGTQKVSNEVAID